MHTRFNVQCPKHVVPCLDSVVRGWTEAVFTHCALRMAASWRCVQYGAH
jgi:hypothetical protein